jgi:small redox-active disulfide protein 2
MKIEILGMGCAKCNKLEKNVRKTVNELGIAADVMKVEDIDEIAARGVMMTPALVIDGKVVSSGRVPGKNEIANILKRRT